MRIVFCGTQEEMGWRSVPCFFSSLLIPHSSGHRESCVHTQPLWKWGYSSCSPQTSSFHSVLRGLANPLPGHGGEIAGFFKALCWLDIKVTGIQGFEEVGENEVHTKQRLEGVHLSIFFL